MAKAKSRRYQPVCTSLWDDGKFRLWKDDEKIMFVYFLTTKHSNLPGLFILPKLYMSRDLNWALERVSKGLRKLCERSVIDYDNASETILLVNLLKHRPLDNPNKVTGAAQAIDEIPDSPLFLRLLKILETENLPEYETLSEALQNRCETLSQPESESVTESESEEEPEEEPDNVEPPVENQEARRLSKLLFEKIKAQDPKAKEPNWTEWTLNMDRLIRLDNRPPKDVEFIIGWCTEDDFWKKNILSTQTLRKQFSKLWIQSRKDAKPEVKPAPEIDYKRCVKNVRMNSRNQIYCPLEHDHNECEWGGTGYCKKWDVKNPPRIDPREG